MALKVTEKLQKLTPAQAYFLICKYPMNSEMLKLTFFDMIYRNILNIKTERKLVDKYSNVLQTYRYVIRGEKFEQASKREFETIFTVIHQEKNRKIQLRSYAKLVVENVKNFSRKYNDLVKSTSEIKPYLNSFFLTNLFDKRTKEGKILGEKIEDYFKAKDNLLKEHVKNKDIDAITNLFNELGTFVIMLDSFDSKFLRCLGKMFKNYNFKNTDSFTSDLMWFESYDSFSSFSDSLDGFDGLGGDFGGAGADGDFGGDSGCSSCSGCSGCGGCGGCG